MKIAHEKTKDFRFFFKISKLKSIFSSMNHLQFHLLDTQSSFSLLLERTHKVLLLLDSLEPTVTNLGSSIDKLESNLFQILPLGVGNQRLSQNDSSLSDTHARTLDHEEIVLDLTVVGEATDGVDGFFGQVGFGGTVVLVGHAVFGLVAGTNSVDLLVDFDSVVITFLTTSSNGVGNSGRMPSTNTGNFSQTSMGLSGQFLGTPSGGNTFSTMTLGNTAAVQVLVLFEDLRDRDLLFEETDSKVNLVGDRLTTVDLQFDDVGLLLGEWQQFHLRMSNQSNGRAVLLDLGNRSFLGFLSTSGVLLPFVLVLRESLLLRGTPVLVVSPLSFIRNMLSPNGLQRSQTSGSFDVTNQTNTDHRRSFEDGNWFDNFLLVQLGTVSVDFSRDVGHTGFVADETGQVTFVGGFVFGVGFDSTEMSSSSFSGEESLGTVSGGFEFSMRHFFSW